MCKFLRIASLLLLGGIAARGGAVSPLHGGEPELTARIYYGGFPLIDENPDLSYLKKIADLPESERLMAGLSTTLAARFCRNQLSAPGEPPSEALETLQLLIDDLPKLPFYLQIWRSADEQATWTLALRMPEKTREIWEPALRLTVEKSAGKSVDEFQTGLAKGWEIAVGGDRLIHLLELGEWLLLSNHPDAFPSFGDMLENIATRGRPFPVEDSDLVSGRLDLKWLIGALPFPESLHLDQEIPPGTELNFTVTPSGASLRTEAKLHFAKPLEIEIAPWHIPVNTIQDPVSSFLAVQGVQPLLENCELLKTLQILPSPNQVFLWSQSRVDTNPKSAPVPFLSYCTIPMNNATNILRNAAERYESAVAPTHRLAGLVSMHWSEQLTKVVFDGLPIVKPFVETAIEPSGQFLTAGLFPVSRPPGYNAPAPAELFNQLRNQTNLVYYHWEITQERLRQFKPIIQIAQMLAFQMRGAQPNAAPQAPHFFDGHEWLAAAGTFLGNTITEATLESPDTLKVVRQSHVGFTALELSTIFNWLEAHDWITDAPKPAKGTDSHAKESSRTATSSPDSVSLR